MNRALVLGAGGFIGGHLVKRLLDEGSYVLAVDWKPLDRWWQVHEGTVVSGRYDARTFHVWCETIEPYDEVYNLAADMGGIGFIEGHKADCMLSVLSSANVLRGVYDWVLSHDVGARVFYSSSACVYPGYRQDDPNVIPLKESDAYPADPEDGYGWEKLFSERLHRHFTEDYGVETRVARYHNIYGPHGTWQGGREKAPAALCRKVATAVLTGDTEVEVWGDGTRTRSFCYVADCVEGTLRLMRSNVSQPLNVGSSVLVTVDQLLTVIEDVARVRLKRRYLLTAPRGVDGRNSDNTLIKRELSWEPSITLTDGIERTYAWVYDQVKRELNP